VDHMIITREVDPSFELPWKMGIWMRGGTFGLWEWRVCWAEEAIRLRTSWQQDEVWMNIEGMINYRSSTSEIMMDACKGFKLYQ
jgi:hypothetical protein